ncbi:MAG: hypothetical protein KGV56_03600 [Gammaproteobacteria bacterium]|nr:hypothetical protein [Gammaproteobacteria bacterium]
MLSDKKTIFQTLRYSIRKLNEDEIEIRHSFRDGYTRLMFRYLFICYIIAGVYFDIKHHRPLFNFVYRDVQAIQEDFTWAFNSDKSIKPIYKEHIKIRNDKEFIKMFPNDKVIPYEKFKQPYIERNRWQEIRAYLHIIWIPFAFLLIFLPTARGLRLNRKHRMIYTPVAVVPVPETGDPLSALNYDRFGMYPFGNEGFLGIGGKLKYFSITVTLPCKKRKPTAFRYGIYPTPNVNHNLHIIKAIREYFNEENPEFLEYITPRYRSVTPLRPFMFIANALSLPSFHFFISSRKMREISLSRLNNEWKNLPESEQQKQIDKTIAKQQAINQLWQAQGFNNEVNDDWAETDNR